MDLLVAFLAHVLALGVVALVDFVSFNSAPAAFHS
jgi:hypothetical protein